MMRNYFPIFLLSGFLIGCQTERERLEEERDGYLRQRDSLEANSHRPNTHWDTHPDNLKMLEKVQEFERKAGEINERLRNLD